jgi:hypothetical protein
MPRLVSKATWVAALALLLLVGGVSAAASPTLTQVTSFTVLTGPSCVNWLPDGKLFYLDVEQAAPSSSDVVATGYLANSDGSNAQSFSSPLTNCPLYSPATGELVGVAYGPTDQDERIVAVKPDGSGERTIGPVQLGHLDLNVTAVSDTGFLSYSSELSTKTFVVDMATGATVFTLSNGHATLSPDGARLAYGGPNPDQTTQPDRGLRVVDIATGVTHYLNVAQGGLAVWTPDSQKLAIATPGGAVVYDADYIAPCLNVRKCSPLVNESGTPPTSITVGGPSGGVLAWSPDGSRLAFAAIDDGSVWSADASGANVTELAPGGTPWLYAVPSWKADGSALVTTGSDQTAGGVYNVYRIDGLGAAVAPPAAPVNVVAAAGDGTAVVSWTPGDAAAVSSYTVSDAGGVVATVTGQTSASVSGLTNGSAYTFTVVANGAGGPSSAGTSNTVTPASGALPPLSASGNAPAGGTVSAPGGSSAASPLGVAVTTPGGGPVTIATAPATGSPPAGGYQFLGQEIDITAPPASAASPLRLVFTIDAAALGAVLPSQVQLFRDGSAIADCADQSGQANPDPCILSRVTTLDGGVTVTILSSHASHWNFGFRDIAKPTVTYSSHPASYTVDQQVSFTCTASDPAPSSGLASSTCHDVSGPAYSFGLGGHSYSATATDKVGNQGLGATSFTVTVTPASLCNLTVLFVKDSAKYLALTAKQKTAADALADVACQAVSKITSKTPGNSKTGFVTAYKAAVDVLQKSGWLSSAQQTTLKSLAAGI